jgi:hypothetical protein
VREIEERAAAYDRGELQMISAEDVFAEARRLAWSKVRGSSQRPAGDRKFEQVNTVSCERLACLRVLASPFSLAKPT